MIRTAFNGEINEQLYGSENQKCFLYGTLMAINGEKFMVNYMDNYMLFYW